MSVQKYRKKPVVIEAIEFLGKENWAEVNAFIGDSFSSISDEPLLLGLKTLEGTLYGSFGDFIIKGVKGEIYACKPDIFALTYEEVFSLNQNENGSSICTVCGDDFNPFRYCSNNHRPYEAKSP